ncbi:hypothetical protein PQ455_07280 [Sphingomonas naphthae]|uniref:LexA repressor DNA-binding domain-containing protein n=1 Tax=Sphingomonas naphthae TaxID=1813468 RepID=A0ABY7TRJ6_9SPHN|nr:hypothetical protein [Sphingomonas naphthae]WCT75010.1 hypothetical protein PQ455_07280 [Sphingomonas naphthae]
MTAAQRELLRFIERYQASHDGMSPSFDDMMIGTGVTSRGAVSVSLKRLEEHGLISREPHRARRITVLGASLAGISDEQLIDEVRRRGLLSSSEDRSMKEAVDIGSGRAR